jgi:MFS superfamily sulfate permease-like transporter
MTERTYLQDLLASIVVFLVAIPLCLGIAIASGAPPTAGLISGIIGGLVVGRLSGCPLQVSGPAAGLVAIVWEAVQTHGLANLGAVIMLAGLMQIAFSWLKLGQWFRAVSPAVVQGMLAGIGVLIFASQFHVMIDDTPKSNGLTNLLTIPQAIYKGIFPMDGTTHHLAAGIGILTITVILLWGLVPKKLKLIPAPLVGVLVAVGVSALFQLPINYISVPGNILSEVHWISTDSLMRLFSHTAFVTALTLAVIASTESLLTATAVDQMQKGPRTNYDRELVAQGTGNILAGILGALPITGVIVRSSANVQAGAATRLSSILHGTWLLIFLIFLPSVLTLIPISSLAAILVYTGYKLVNPANIRNLMKFGKWEVGIYFATIVAIVMTNLLEGILIGLGLAAIKLLISQSTLKIDVISASDENQVEVLLEGSANFISLPKLAAAVEGIEPGRDVHVLLNNLHYIDHACLEFLINWEKRYQEQNGSVSLEWNVIASKFPVYQSSLQSSTDASAPSSNKKTLTSTIPL